MVLVQLLRANLMGKGSHRGRHQSCLSLQLSLSPAAIPVCSCEQTPPPCPAEMNTGDTTWRAKLKGRSWVTQQICAQVLLSLVLLMAWGKHHCLLLCYCWNNEGAASRQVSFGSGVCLYFYPTIIPLLVCTTRDSPRESPTLI